MMRRWWFMLLVCSSFSFFVDFYNQNLRDFFSHNSEISASGKLFFVTDYYPESGTNNVVEVTRLTCNVVMRPTASSVTTLKADVVYNMGKVMADFVAG